ncbi:cytochrome P450 2G1-like [Hyperolius riggenbachi]|uniref:cytochrome P450 2G1-like n=1 Tax=Hyperolius riggenbachi TaxID=752182 RepID=UPI0035A2B0AA
MWLFTTELFILLLFLLSIAWLKQNRKKRTSMPPGPLPLPLIGNMLQVKPTELLSSLQKLKDKYGPVFTLYFGSRPTVMIWGYEAIKEALVDNKDAFGGRGNIPTLSNITKGHGIMTTNGERWKQMRRFTISTLRNLGMGKRSIKDRIQEEAQYLAEEFDKTKGTPFDPMFFMSCAVSNIICSVVFGSRFEFSDKLFLSLLSHINGIIRFMNSLWGLVLFSLPFLQHIPGPHQQGMHHVAALKSFVHEKVEESRRTLDPQSPRHFIDCFLIKMQQEQLNPVNEFHLENLVSTVVDLFFAGTETISTTLRYGFLILLKHPEIQVKIQNEIEHVVGQQSPSIEDRTMMPYTDAVIHEILRFSDIVPTGLPHCTTTDITFRGFVIPKGTEVLPLLTSTLKDPQEFSDPAEFCPERFLNGAGALKKNPALIPFSAGKRICPGEGLAHMVLFLYFTTLLQRFSFTTTVPREDLDLSPDYSPVGHLPRYYKMCANTRTSTLEP